MARELYPRAPAKPETPRCQAIRSEKYANDTWATDKQCMHSSRYEIDGQFYCHAHAKLKALEIVLAQGN